MITQRLTRLRESSIVRDGVPLLGLYWIYSSIRWFVARESPYEAFENAFRIIQLEKQLGIFYEPAIQSWLIDRLVVLVHIANAFYTLGYFPVLILCGVLLYRYQPARFHVFKLTFLLGLGLALICFSLFPLAPPRMLPEVGFVDTQQVFSDGLYNHELVLSFYNPYAAMPSLHFGWALLVGIMASSFERRLLKLAGVLYPSFMALVIVTTGHHFFLDIIGGGIVVGLAYSAVKALPYVGRELLSTPVATHGAIRPKENPLGSWYSIQSMYHIGSHWPKDQREFILSQNRRSAFIALLTNRILPL